MYINGKAYNTKFVDLKKIKDGRDRYNKLIYMIDLEKIKIKLQKRKGREYFAGEVKISDPNGLYSKKIYVLVE